MRYLICILHMARMHSTSADSHMLPQVGARSTTMASALAECYPSLKLVVQLSTSPDPDPAPTELDSRIVVQSRPWASPQTVRDAAVYALRVPYDFPVVSASAQTRPARLRAELEAHLGVLRENDAARLIFTTRLLPCHSDTADDKQGNDLQPGLDAAKGLVFDMSLLQLADDRELEVADLRELVRSVGDGNGHLELEDKLQVHSASRDRAFEVRFHRMP
jgi:hypothetical protein